MKFDWDEIVNSKKEEEEEKNREFNWIYKEFLKFKKNFIFQMFMAFSVFLSQAKRKNDEKWSRTKIKNIWKPLISAVSTQICYRAMSRGGTK